MIAIKPAKKIVATVECPPSKSYTNRALLIAALAEGVSTLHNPLFSDDTKYMRLALEQFGIQTIEAKLKRTEGKLKIIEATHKSLKPSSKSWKEGSTLLKPRSKLEPISKSMKPSSESLKLKLIKIIKPISKSLKPS